MKRNRQMQSVVSKSLEETLVWRQNQEESFERKERELEREEADLQEEFRKIKEKIQSVQNLQEKTKNERAELSGKELQRKRQIIFEGLQNENEVLLNRSVEYKKIEEKQQKNLENMLSIPEIAKKVEEYEDFLDKEDALSQLPASYRDAILAHHQHVRKDLKPVFDAMNSPLPRSEDLEPISLTIQIFMEPFSDEEVTEIAVLFPVRFERYVNWQDDRGSLEDLLLFRINGLLSGVLKKIGMPNASIQEEDLDGYMLLLMDITSEISGDVKMAFQSEISRINKLASELNVVGITLEPVFLASELIDFAEEETL
ncbi:MAG: hypothetical protein CL916_09820 [Deltaproteobacteria bacterium]|nr:hypothetical protein [Deltaproteobacteria bacterium]